MLPMFELGCLRSAELARWRKLEKGFAFLGQAEGR